MKAEIIAVGTELLLGQIVDTNSAYMAQQLTTVGLDLHFKATVGDNLERLKNTLQTALRRSDFILLTGGLGPTLDDLTREAVAEVTGKKLIFHPYLNDQIENFFKRLGRSMSANNRKQAYIPEGAIPIENPVGTAPGFIVQISDGAVIAVPGVPHEMRYFMDQSVLPYLRRKMGIQEVIVSRVLKLFGLGESMVDERIKDLITAGENPTIGLLAHTQIGEIHIRLTAKAGQTDRAQELNARLENKIRERLEEYIFGTDDETYEGVTGSLLRQSHLRLAVAETAFGTSVIQTLKALDGSEQFLSLGLTLSNAEAAQKLLNLPGRIFQNQGLLGLEATKALAEGVRQLAGANLALGITGRAAKEKSEDHLIYMALARPQATEGFEQRWPHAMRYVENRMTKMALAQVRRFILESRNQEG